MVKYSPPSLIILIAILSLILFCYKILQANGQGENGVDKDEGLIRKITKQIRLPENWLVLLNWNTYTVSEWLLLSV